ncbi:MAG: glycosyltransferase family 9 protein [Acidimicrobiia bacterium]|nr:glycosyltransferase family 9 protein [Acidimicrobiia bacterium]
MPRFLIVRLGALGDIVHAVPVAAALRDAFPRAHIDWVVSARHEEILTFVKAVTSRIVVRPSVVGLSIAAAIRAIRRTKYDVALDLQGLLKSAVIARGSGAARVIGFVARYLREPLGALFYTEQYDPGGEGLHAPAERRHVTTINLGMLRLLGVPDSPPTFPFELPASPIATHAREMAAGPYALLNPGAAWPNKRWPAERFAALASGLFERRRLRSAVLWGPGERGLAEEIAARAGSAAFVTPETRIGDIMVLARGAQVMVSGDTGPTHIGAAMGVPIVGLYGPTRPERNGPWDPADISVSRATMCQCQHRRRCHAARWCLLDIPVEDVLGAVERRLDAGRALHG